MATTIRDAYDRLTAPGAPFEIRSEEIRGVTYRTWATAPADLRQVLEQGREHGDAVFMVYEDERLTNDRSFRLAAAFAHALVDRYGVGPGDRVAIAVRNYPEWVLAFWGTVAVGAVAVPLNGWWEGEELEYGLADSGSRVLVADRQRLERLGDERRRRLGPATILVREGDAPEGVDRWDDVVGDGADTLPAADLDPDQDATIFYTSGTTGFPKGAVGTHRNMVTNLWTLMCRGAAGALVKADSGAAPVPEPEAQQTAIVLTVPLFHATGCHSVMVPAWFTGAKLVMMYRWDADRALELIEREQVTTFTGVPTMVKELLESPEFARRDTSSLRSVGAGGAATPPGLVERMAEEFPRADPGNGYGLTETSSVSTQNVGDDYRAHPDSVGVASPVVELKVVDESGAALGPGEVGELWIKGPNVVRGYWGKPEATEAAITDGWLHSGDIARIDDEGFVYLLDRAKDLVIRGGENISTVEVEGAVHHHPDVMEVAVFGVPDDRLGEAVGCVVLPKPGREPAADALVESLTGHLSSFKIPSRWWCSPETLPRNAAGKIVKRDVRERALSGAYAEL